VTSFAQITSDVTVQQKLQAAYGTVDKIDPLEGMFAEDHVAGGDVGPTIKAILVDQFSRLRDGDRFFYLNEQWTPDELKILQQGTTLAKVIEANTNLTNLQSNVFFFKASLSGTVVSAPSTLGRRDAGAQGLSGITVELEDTSGNVLATTVTDSKGHYSFTDQTGLPGTGQFTVRLVVPSGFTQTSPNPGTISISRGDVNVHGVNLALTPTSQATTTSTSGLQAMSGASASTTDGALAPAAVDTLFAAASGQNG
jgi:hypothetical protein